MRQSKLRTNPQRIDEPRTTAKINNGEWHTIDDVAAYFQTTPKTVRKWIYERRLRYYKVGGLVRIHKNDLKKFPVLVPTTNEILDSREY